MIQGFGGCLVGVEFDSRQVSGGQSPNRCGTPQERKVVCATFKRGNMSGIRGCFVVAVLVVLFPVSSSLSSALTGAEIIEKAQKKQLGESFRASLEIQTFSGNRKTSQHQMWMMGQVEKDSTTVFIDFVEPEDSKGVRILCILRQEKDPEAYMYLPATGQAFPIDVRDPATEIAGTGLTMADFQPLIPEKGDTATLLREENLDGKPSYLIQITKADSGQSRYVWIERDSLHLLRLEEKSKDGKILREMRVVEFFDTLDGKRYPREEEIVLPTKDVRIKIRQENAVFGITIPEELTNPATFGNFKWQVQF